MGKENLRFPSPYHPSPSRCRHRPGTPHPLPPTFPHGCGGRHIFTYAREAYLRSSIDRPFVKFTRPSGACGTFGARPLAQRERDAYRRAVQREFARRTPTIC